MTASNLEGTLILYSVPIKGQVVARNWSSILG